jgi:hypothetical protein
MATLGYANTIEPTILPKSKKVAITKSVSEKVFFWEVETSDGVASGYTTSEALAKKSIKLLSKGTVLQSKIIEIYKNN